MRHADTVSAYILDAQVQLFEDARLELQMPLTAMAKHAKLDVQTLNAWAQGRNGLSLWGMKHLLLVPGLAPYLSRIFEPEEYVLMTAAKAVDHDALCDLAEAYAREKLAAHRADSELAERLGPGELDRLNRKVVELRARAA